jgi:hypothetical protein
MTVWGRGDDKEELKDIVMEETAVSNPWWV